MTSQAARAVTVLAAVLAAAVVKGPQPEMRTDVLQAIATVVGILVGLVTIAALARPFWVRHRNRKAAERAFWDQFRQDWAGQAARPGVEARPGVMARLGDMGDRLGKVEKELHPNGGSSMKDQISRIEGTVEEINRQQAREGGGSDR